MRLLIEMKNKMQPMIYLLKSNLLDSDGAFLSKDAEAIASGSPALIAAVKRTRAAIAASKKDGEGDGTGTAGKAPSVEIPFEKQKDCRTSKPYGCVD